MKRIRPGSAGRRARQEMIRFRADRLLPNQWSASSPVAHSAISERRRVPMEEKLQKFERLHKWVDECLDNIGRAQAQLSLDIERVQQAIAAAEKAE